MGEGGVRLAIQDNGTGMNRGVREHRDIQVETESGEYNQATALLPLLPGGREARAGEPTPG